jgi:hypothetical protein
VTPPEPKPEGPRAEALLYLARAVDEAGDQLQGEWLAQDPDFRVIREEAPAHWQLATRSRARPAGLSQLPESPWASHWWVVTLANLAVLLSVVLPLAATVALAVALDTVLPFVALAVAVAPAWPYSRWRRARYLSRVREGKKVREPWRDRTRVEEERRAEARAGARLAPAMERVGQYAEAESTWGAAAVWGDPEAAIRWGRLLARRGDLLGAERAFALTWGEPGEVVTGRPRTPPRSEPPLSSTPPLPYE